MNVKIMHVGVNTYPHLMAFSPAHRTEFLSFSKLCKKEKKYFNNACELGYKCIHTIKTA